MSKTSTVTDIDITTEEAYSGLDALRPFVSTPPSGFDDRGTVKSQVLFTQAAQTALGSTLTERLRQNNLIAAYDGQEYLDLTALIRASRQGAGR